MLSASIGLLSVAVSNSQRSGAAIASEYADSNSDPLAFLISSSSVFHLMFLLLQYTINA